MRELSGVPFSTLTTLQLGGVARRLLIAETPDEVVSAVLHADRAGEPVLVIGGGSNLVVADDGFAGTVVQVANRGVHVDVSADQAALTAQAGESWDRLVAQTVADGFAGIEALSGIPGLTGATPVQNVGAYGQELADAVSRVRVLDRADRAVHDLDRAACGFGYRTSKFKGTDRFVVLEVALDLEVSPLGRPVRYAELARALSVDVGDRVPLAEVRAAVLGLRRGKGMVVDPADPDSVSAGSFFTNPLLDADAARRLPAAAPRWPQPDGLVKTSAAWLIEQAGFGKGYGNGRARISSKHALALTNRGGATADDVLALAREVRDGVRRRFGIELVNEPVLVGVQL